MNHDFIRIIRTTSVFEMRCNECVVKDYVTIGIRQFIFIIELWKSFVFIAESCMNEYNRVGLSKLQNYFYRISISQWNFSLVSALQT